MSADGLNNDQASGQNEAGQGVVSPERDGGRTAEDYALIERLLSGGAAASNGSDEAAGGNAESVPSSDEPPAVEEKPFWQFDDEELPKIEAIAKGEEKPKLLAELGAALKLTPEDVLSLAVAGEDGEPVAIRDLLDAQAKQKQFALERDEFEDMKREDAAKLRAVAAMQGRLMERVKQILPPDVVARAFADVAQEAQADEAEQQRKLLSYLPQWREPATMRKELDGMTELLSKFDFERDELLHAPDARLYNFVRWAWSLHSRYERQKGDLKQVLKKVPLEEPSKRVSRTPTSQQISNLAAKDRDAAVAKILGV